MSDSGANLLSDQLLLAESERNTKPNLTVVNSAGASLAAARLQKDWSIQQVAEQLKLSPRQIVALEANQFEALPKMVIVRGFVRAYAKLLKIDADSVVGLLPKDTESIQWEAAMKPALSTPFLESRLSLMGRQENNYRYLIGAAVLAVLAVIFFLLQRSEIVGAAKNWMGQSSASVPDLMVNADPAPGASGSTIPVPVLNTEPLPIQPVLTDSAQAVVNVAKNQPASESQQVLQGGVSNEAPAGKTEAENVRAVSVAAQPEKPMPSVPANGLVKFKFNQDSWIQIKRENGSILTSHLARAGTLEVFEMKESLQVKIGNAAGVVAELRGTPLEIAPEKGSNVVNLILK